MKDKPFQTLSCPCVVQDNDLDDPALVREAFRSRHVAFDRDEGGAWRVTVQIHERVAVAVAACNHLAVQVEVGKREIPPHHVKAAGFAVVAVGIVVVEEQEEMAVFESVGTAERGVPSLQKAEEVASVVAEDHLAKDTAAWEVYQPAVQDVYTLDRFVNSASHTVAV